MRRRDVWVTEVGVFREFRRSDMRSSRKIVERESAESRSRKWCGSERGQRK